MVFFLPADAARMALIVRVAKRPLLLLLKK